jgi:VanZ family protein
VAAIIRWLCVVLWMSAIFALSSIPSLHVPFAHSSDFVLRKLAHIGAYAVLTALLWWAFQRYTGRKVRSWLFAALAAALYGIADEWHQSWIAGRSGGFRDIGIDALGIVASYAFVRRQPSQGMTSNWRCPKCQAIRVHRSRRRGRLEWSSRFIRLAPFRCDICNHRFWQFTLRGR